MLIFIYFDFESMIINSIHILGNILLGNGLNLHFLGLFILNQLKSICMKIITFGNYLVKFF